jgi:hypothetical protein
MFKKFLSFFDKLEDYVRINLSHTPIIYALVGAVGIILLWKGVWEVAQGIPGLYGFGSIVMGVIILLVSGLLVSFFIGDSIIISGFKKEKKLVEKSELDILKAEHSQTKEIVAKLDHLEKEVHEIKTDHRHNL